MGARSGWNVQQRARVLLALCFVVALGGLFVGTRRSSSSADSVQLVVDAQETVRGARRFEGAVLSLGRALWRYEAQASPASVRELRQKFQLAAERLDACEAAIARLLRDPGADPALAWKDASGRPLLDDQAPLSRARSVLREMRRSVRPALQSETLSDGERQQIFRRTQASASDLASDAEALAENAEALAIARATEAERAVNLVSRDQLVLLLAVLFALPFVVVFGPRFIATPLSDLVLLAKQVEAGRVKRIEAPRGDDEVARVTRAVREAVRKLEESDARQRGKIFEMRRVIRALLLPLKDAVLVVGRAGKIDYANPRAAEILVSEVHHLETTVVDEVLFSPGFSDALERAWEGDVLDDGVDLRIEADDGRVQNVRAVLRPVRGSDGQITRVVVVMDCSHTAEAA